LSRDRILHDSWSISAALARGFSDRHFERGEGLGDEVGRNAQPRHQALSKPRTPWGRGWGKADSGVGERPTLVYRMGGVFSLLLKLRYLLFRSSKWEEIKPRNNQPLKKRHGAL